MLCRKCADVVWVYVVQEMCRRCVVFRCAGKCADVVWFYVVQENVLTLYYSFYQRPRKRRRVMAPAPATSQDNDTSSSSATSCIKAKAGSSSTAKGTSTSTSTVTIVEASDSGCVTDAEGGTKTTLSLSIPATSATLPLPLPLPVALPVPTDVPANRQSSAMVDFDDDDDDDDDERPLIIVTDPPTASSTPIDTGLPGTESGVTIISHPRTLSSASSGEAAGAGGVAPKSSPSANRQSPGSAHPSVSSAVDVQNDASAGGSFSGGGAVVLTNNTTTTSSASAVDCTVGVKDVTATTTTSALSSEGAIGVSNSGTAGSSSSGNGAVGVTNSGTAVSSSSGIGAIGVPNTATTTCSSLGEGAVGVADTATNVSFCGDDAVGVVDTATDASFCVDDAVGFTSNTTVSVSSSGDGCSNTSSPSSRTTEATSGRETVHHTGPSLLADPSHSKETVGCSEPRGPSDLSRPAGNSSCPTQRHPSDPSKPSSCPEEQPHAADPWRSEEPRSPHSEPAPPAESSRAVCEGTCSNGPSRRDVVKPPEQSASPKEHSRSTESSRPTEPLRPAEASRSVDPVRFAEPPRSREAPRSSEQQRGAGSSKSGSSRQREDNKREARPPSAAVKGALAEAASSVTTSVGIFERIYSVTSNCTASGIKSIFKTTAFVPAAASRRYSDVSGLSAAAATGGRRASTGGGGTAKGRPEKERSKGSGDGRQKASPSRDSRSSLDALSSLAKHCKVSSAEVSRAITAHKLASPTTAEPAKGPPCLPGAPMQPKPTDRRQSSSGDLGAPPSTGKRSGVSSDPDRSRAGGHHGAVAASTSGSTKSAASAESRTSHRADVPTEDSGACPNSGAGRDGGAGDGDGGAAGDSTPGTMASVGSRLDAKAPSVVITADLRVKIPKCNIYDERSLASDGHIKDRQHSDGGDGLGGAKVTGCATVSPHSPSKTVSDNNRPTSVDAVGSGEPVPASGVVGATVTEEGKRTHQTLGGVKDRQSSSNNNGASKRTQASPCVSGSRSGGEVKREHSSSGADEKRPSSTNSVSSAVSTSIGSSCSKTSSTKTSGAGEAKKQKRDPSLCTSSSDTRHDSGSASIKREGGVSNANIKHEGGVTSANVKREGGVSNANVKHEGGVSSASVKREGGVGSVGLKRESDAGSAGVKREEGVSSAGVKRESGVSNAGVKRDGGVSSAGVKRAHSAISTAVNNGGSSAHRSASTTSAGLPSGTTLVSTSGTPTNHTTKVAVSASQLRVPTYCSGPEAKKARMSSSSSQFSMSPPITPTILSSSSAASIGKPSHRAAVSSELLAVSQPPGPLPSNKIALASSVAGTVSGIAKIRPAGNHAVSAGRLLAPGQRVDSLLFRATNRLAAATAARPSSSCLPASSPGQRKVRSESVDSRMSFINKTFGGGKSSKETCVSPAGSRGEISFSARHILSPTFHSHSGGISRVSSSPTAAAAAARPKPAAPTTTTKDKNSAGACDLSKRSTTSLGSREDGLANGSSSRGGGAESMKLDIPRLSTSSRDSVFASESETSPTPPPKYSDINRNPIKLEPGSKLCRKDTWVPAENGGRRSTGSVGSPSSLGSGPGSPLESERSPARESRRPSDSELLLSQRWHGLHHHPHLLAIPHHRDPTTAAAVAALYNGHFKVPPAAKYLPLAPEQAPRSASPEPMPLDYSTSSSSSSK